MMYVETYDQKEQQKKIKKKNPSTMLRHGWGIFLSA